MRGFIALMVLLAAPAMAEQHMTTVTIDGMQIPVQIQLNTIDISIPIQCEKFCESDDLDCDGVLDQTCPGLTYNVCEEGSIVESYMEAAFTGFCIDAVAVEPEPIDCDEPQFSPAPPECDGF